MNELIPLMVIVPLMAALLISAFSRFNTVTKIFAFVVASNYLFIHILATDIYCDGWSFNILSYFHLFN